MMHTCNTCEEEDGDRSSRGDAKSDLLSMVSLSSPLTSFDSKRASEKRRLIYIRNFISVLSNSCTK